MRRKECRSSNTLWSIFTGFGVLECITLSKVAPWLGSRGNSNASRKKGILPAMPRFGSLHKPKLHRPPSRVSSIPVSLSLNQNLVFERVDPEQIRSQRASCPRTAAQALNWACLPIGCQQTWACFPTQGSKESQPKVRRRAAPPPRNPAPSRIQSSHPARGSPATQASRQWPRARLHQTPQEDVEA